MKRLLLLVVTIMTFACLTHAQDTFVCHGTIIDELGEPAIGATVSTIGGKAAVPTDLDGKFALRVPKSTKEIQISYIGYETMKVPASA